jgi:large subunit ribosomal protein L13
MSTYIPKAGGPDRKWFLLDAKDQVLGKLATAAATILSGKRNPAYTPFLDTGDHVIVINAAQVHLTGRKTETKVYRRHSGYLGGLKSIVAGRQIKKNPARVIEDAVRGMLPKTKLGRAMFGKLKVYAGTSHPHQAQKPQALAIAARRAR